MVSDRLYESPMLRSVVSALLLAAAFPPSPITTLAFVAFIPFLSVFNRETSATRMLRNTLGFLVTFHAAAVYWTGGFTHMQDGWLMTAGASLILLHPWFMVPFIMGAWYVRQRLGESWGLTAFGALWLAFEFFHERGELSFPWIAVGHSQAYDTLRIQMADIFSLQGLSLHILAFNILGYILLTQAVVHGWKGMGRKGTGILTSMALLYIAPLLYGWVRLADFDGSERGARAVTVTVVQPNVDPWEKWKDADRRSSVYSQVRTLDSLSRAPHMATDLVLWPETAVPAYILLGRAAAARATLESLATDLSTNVVTGFPHARYFSASEAPITATPVEGTDTKVESYNSILLVTREGKTGPIYSKVVLVPFAERIPHAERLRFLVEPFRWNVGIGSWGIGEDTTIFSIATRTADSVRFAAMICYESVYPSYVRSFVNKGAEFLVVVTNDSWWGNTSGAYQHAAYASLRAVETRRWVVQCANGGISTVVDPIGRHVKSTAMYTQTSFVTAVQPRTELTTYVKYGDILGTINATFAGLLMILAILGKDRVEKLQQRMRTRGSEESVRNL